MYQIENDLNLCNELFIVLKLIRKYFNKFCKKHNITQVQFDVLYWLYISGDGGVNMTTLGNKLEMAKSGVTLLIDKMVLDGLVRKRPDIYDRRIIKVTITEKGNEIMKEVFPKSEIFKTSILGFLGQEEKEVLIKLTTKVKEKLDDKIYCKL